MNTASTECIFCQIVAKQVPAHIVFDGGDTLFFHDTDAHAKVHVLGIPKEHLGSLQEMRADHHAMIGKLLHDVVHVAESLNLRASGYRVITNIGKDAGQAVPHLHFHLLGGEPLGPLVAH